MLSPLKACLIFVNYFPQTVPIVFAGLYFHSFADNIGSCCLFIAEEMEAFAERSIDAYFEFSILQFFIVLFVAAALGIMFGAIFHWHVGLGVGVGIFCLLYAILGKFQQFDSMDGFLCRKIK